MPVNLNASMSGSHPTPDELTMLQGLQPNIIKGHVRDVLTVLFLKFETAAGGREFIARLAGQMKSAEKHLQEIEEFKKTKKPGSPYVGFGLSKWGYIALELTTIPKDPSFEKGMQANKGLHDPHPEKWEKHFQSQEDLHAIVLVGDMLKSQHDVQLEKVNAAIEASPGVRVLETQDGLGQHNANGEGLEHFGYVDGRSQPLFLTEDVAAEKDGTSSWNPEFALGRVLVPDPAAPDPAVHFGSYFVFRKLEQNVRTFKESERDLAKRLGIEDPELAGAMLVGRFEDGTPVTLFFQDGVGNPVANNFNYKGDELGAKCPFAGHVRKTNPRGAGGFENESAERLHIMARRGQTYGIRADNLNDGRIDNKPTGGVGLLFMAFNSDIANQFEFTQASWANFAGFPKTSFDPKPGLDPLIGQPEEGEDMGDITFPTKWGHAGSMKTEKNIPSAVKMLGGAYFFMPSLPFLKSLGPASAPPPGATGSVQTAVESGA